MPLLRINANFDTSLLQKTLPDLSDLLCRELNKPPQFMMVLLEPSAPIHFAGSFEPALALELKSVGLPLPLAKHMAGVLCPWFHEHWQVPVNRIYLEFSDVPGARWGWNSTVFE